MRDANRKRFRCTSESGIGGKLRLVKDVTKFPKHLQVQEYPR